MVCGNNLKFKCHLAIVKALLEHSYTHLYCPWLLFATVWNIYSLALYRKRLLTPALANCFMRMRMHSNLSKIKGSLSIIFYFSFFSCLMLTDLILWLASTLFYLVLHHILHICLLSRPLNVAFSHQSIFINLFLLTHEDKNIR